jgi:hypothetical protein
MNPSTTKTTPPPAKSGHDHDKHRHETVLDLTLSEENSPPAQFANSLLQYTDCHSNYTTNHNNTNNNNRVDSSDHTNTLLQQDDMLLRSNRLIGEKSYNNGTSNFSEANHFSRPFSNTASYTSQSILTSGSITNNNQSNNCDNYQTAVLQPNAEKASNFTQQNNMTGTENGNSAAGKRVIANRSKKFQLNDDTVLQSLILEEKPVGSFAWETVAQKYNSSQTVQRTAKQLQKHFTDSVRRAKEKPSGSTKRPAGAEGWLELNDELEQHYAMQTLGSNNHYNNNYANQNYQGSRQASNGGYSNNNGQQHSVCGPNVQSTFVPQNVQQQQSAAPPQITNNFAIYSPSYYNQGTLGGLVAADEIAVSVSRHCNKRVNDDAQALQTGGGKNTNYNIVISTISTLWYLQLKRNKGWIKL